MVTQLEHPTQEQTAHISFAESLKRHVIEQTDNGRRIIESVVSIMEGNAPNCTPWHQLEAAKLLDKLGSGEPPAKKSNPRTAEESITQPLSTANHKPPLPAGEGWGEGEDPSQPACPSCSSMSDELIKLNKRLVSQIRIATHDGASMIRNLVDIMEGDEPYTKGKDRIDAIQILLRLCYDNPAQPDPEFMMFYAPCHPDCLCVCKDLPDDHPEVVKAHTPPTAEQREQWAKEQAQQEIWDKRTDELIERKMRAKKQRQLEQFYSPDAMEDRRIEREKLRKNRQIKREQEKESRRELRERISRESRFDTWQYDQQQQEKQEQDRERARSP